MARMLCTSGLWHMSGASLLSDKAHPCARAVMILQVAATLGRVHRCPVHHVRVIDTSGQAVELKSLQALLVDLGCRSLAPALPQGPLVARASDALAVVPICAACQERHQVRTVAAVRFERPRLTSISRPCRLLNSVKKLFASTHTATATAILIEHLEPSIVVWLTSPKVNAASTPC